MDDCPQCTANETRTPTERYQVIFSKGQQTIIRFEQFSGGEKLIFDYKYWYVSIASKSQPEVFHKER